MAKPVIGILPTLTYKVGPSIFDDQFQFVNSYTKKVQESGGKAIGLLMPDGRLDPEVLDVCDGFLIPGGTQIRKYVYEVLQYSLKNDVPVLGVCLGSQAMSIYSAILAKADNRQDLTYDEIVTHYDELKAENDGSLLVRLPASSGHSHLNITRENIDETRHPIRIIQGTLLHDIYNNTELKVTSFHNFGFKFVSNGFIAPAFAMDGVREAIEYHDPKRFMLGVQFHPELDADNLLFDRLVYESEKRHR